MQISLLHLSQIRYLLMRDPKDKPMQFAKPPISSTSLPPGFRMLLIPRRTPRGLRLHQWNTALPKTASNLLWPQATSLGNSKALCISYEGIPHTILYCLVDLNMVKRQNICVMFKFMFSPYFDFCLHRLQDHLAIALQYLGEATSLRHFHTRRPVCVLRGVRPEGRGSRLY